MKEQNEITNGGNDSCCVKESPENTSKKKYYLCIEGQEHPWEGPTITTEEIANLGGWPPDQGVIEIDKENNERTLQPGEIVTLKPGHGFSKKVCWKRGLNIAEERIEAELRFLRNKYSSLKYHTAGQWVLIPNYQFGNSWFPNQGEVAFQIPLNGFPGTPPYGIYVHVGIRHRGNLPNNYKEPSPAQPPFQGTWGVFSWSPESGFWRPGATVESGTNLLNWVDGFSARFKEGV